MEFEVSVFNFDYKKIINISKSMCNNKQFELDPHQLFVKNFLSFETPYNSLLLFHGLGSGKTMTGLAVAKEFSDKKIVIVAPAAVKRRFEDDLNKLGMDSKRFSIYSYESFRPVFEKDNKILNNKSVKGSAFNLLPE